MDEALLAAYRATDYRVRLARGGFAVIRIGLALPAPLRSLAQDQPWGFLSAWNPGSVVTPQAENRVAQRALLLLFRASSGIVALRPGVGAARHGSWREPSLWVAGPGLSTLDSLARRFGQFAYVHGLSESPAQLRLVPVL